MASLTVEFIALSLFFLGCTGGLVPWELQDGLSTYLTDARRPAGAGLFRSGAAPPQWDYQNDEIAEAEVHGPSSWHLNYPACSGHRQSPIAIDSTQYLESNSSSLEALSFVDYDDASINDLWTLVNNGHSVQMTADFITPPQLQGGALPAKYTFKQIHLHWGSSNSAGSEHVLNGQRYPLEIHLVHQRKDILDGGDAATLGDGIAVLGVVGEVSEHAPTNALVTGLITALESIVDPNARTTVSLPEFSLDDLLPKNHSYVRYLGSLTTPPCSEAVVWSLLSNPLPIAQSELDALRHLWAKKAAPHAQSDAPSDAAVQDVPQALKNNFRPLQPLNGRIPTYFHDAGSKLNSC